MQLRKMLKKIKAVIGLVLCCALIIAVQTEQGNAQPQTESKNEATASFCELVDEAQSIVAKTKMQSFSAATDCRVQNKEQISHYVRDAIARDLPADQLRNEGAMLSFLGLIPIAYDYEQEIKRLYEMQLGGYYDPYDKYLSLAQWIPPESQKPVVMHEMVHALQDQRHDLKKFIDERTLTGDELLARMALVEGDATITALDADRVLHSKPGLSTLEFLPEVAISVGYDFNLPYGNSFPAAMQRFVSFPYTEGARFIHTLLKKGGYQEIDTAFLRPPRSTEEIFEPAKYFDSQKGFRDISEQELLTPQLLQQWNIADRDRLGVLGLQALFKEYSSSGSPAPYELLTQWNGDLLLLLKPRNSKETSTALYWRISWDDEKGAQKFLQWWRKMLSRRSKEIKCEKSRQSCALTKQLSTNSRLLLGTQGQRNEVLISFVDRG